MLSKVKILSQVIMILTAINLVGCQNKMIDTLEEKSIDGIEFTKTVIVEDSSVVPDALDDTVHILQTKEEIQKLDDELGTHIDLNKIITEYYGELESKFYDNYVLVVGFDEEGAMDSCTYDKVEKDGNQITIHIQREAPLIAIDEVVSCIFIGGIEKDKVADWSQIEAKIEKERVYNEEEPLYEE